MPVLWRAVSVTHVCAHAIACTAKDTLQSASKSGIALEFRRLKHLGQASFLAVPRTKNDLPTWASASAAR